MPAPAQDSASAPAPQPTPTPVPTPEPMQEPPLEPSVIKGLREALGDIDEVVEAALEDLPKRVRNLHVAIEAGDAQQVRMIAHTLAGSICNFGARRLTDVARKLESTAAAEDLGSAPACLAQVEAEAQRVAVALRALLGQPAHESETIDEVQPL